MLVFCMKVYLQLINMYFKLSFLLFSYDISLETGKTVEKTRRKWCAHERLDEFCFTEHEE